MSGPYDDDNDGAGAVGGGASTDGGGKLIGASVSTAGANGGDAKSGGCVLPALESTWLFVGVVSCGVIS